jgi:hypothetical protein
MGWGEHSDGHDRSFGNSVVGFVRGGEKLASFGETVRAVWRTLSIDTNCQRAAHTKAPISSSGNAPSASRESVEEGCRRRGAAEEDGVDRVAGIVRLRKSNLEYQIG